MGCEKHSVGTGVFFSQEVDIGAKIWRRGQSDPLRSLGEEGQERRTGPEETACPAWLNINWKAGQLRQRMEPGDTEQTEESLRVCA